MVGMRKYSEKSSQ